MEAKKKRNRRITKASLRIITLCIILLIIQAFSAGAEVVNKEKGPEKETEIDSIREKIDGIDTKQAYICNLPSGEKTVIARSYAIFDGCIFYFKIFFLIFF